MQVAAENAKVAANEEAERLTTQAKTLNQELTGLYVEYNTLSEDNTVLTSKCEELKSTVLDSDASVEYHKEVIANLTGELSAKDVEIQQAVDDMRIIRAQAEDAASEQQVNIEQMTDALEAKMKDLSNLQATSEEVLLFHYVFIFSTRS